MAKVKERKSYTCPPVQNTGRTKETWPYAVKHGRRLTVKSRNVRDGGMKVADMDGNEIIVRDPGGPVLSKAEVMRRVEDLLDNTGVK